MKKYLPHILLTFSILLGGTNLFAQSQSSVRDTTKQITADIDGNILHEYLRGYYSQVFGIGITDIANTDLYESIEDWLGTPYRYAGKTLEGIDCSSFVNKIYESVYCYILTGNSADLAKQVTKLPKDKLKEGDLVFFKINKRNISHVGVYLGDDKFAHASRTKGVIISDLNQPYYRKYFVKAGRVNFPTN